MSAMIYVKNKHHFYIMDIGIYYNLYLCFGKNYN